MRIVDKFFTPLLNSFINMMVDQGPSTEELKLMGVLSIMDETLRALAEDTESEYQCAALQTYSEIEKYVTQCEDNEN